MAHRADIDEVKVFGKVYTPAGIVRHMLKPLFAGSLKDVRVCDPACGSGDFLVPVAQEVSRRARAYSGKEQQAHIRTLRQLTGYEIDLEAARSCRRRLSEAVEQVLGRRYPLDFWQVRRVDGLDAWVQDAGAFDWVVGNPPYVRIQNLENDRRDKIKGGGWAYFRGSSDLYLVFFELGLRLLAEGGNLIYISPSGWLRNRAGQAMREDIAKNHRIVSLYDYRDHQVFPGVSTYTCITHIQNHISSDPGRVYYWRNGAFTDSCTLSMSKFRWAIVPSELVEAERSGVPLGEIADIHVGIQTLADRVFILEVAEWRSEQVICRAGDKEVKLEIESARKITKASVLKNGRDRVERVIIYPYDEAGKLMPERTLKVRFPLAYAWLIRNKERLLARDKGAFSRTKWYAYGREVGIRSAFGRKILTSGMNAQPNFQICNDPEALFYAGYCVKPRIDIDLEDLKEWLNSPTMAQHVRSYSQPYRGGWFSYAKQYIKDFPVPAHLVRANG